MNESILVDCAVGFPSPGIGVESQSVCRTSQSLCTRQRGQSQPPTPFDRTPRDFTPTETTLLRSTRSTQVIRAAFTTVKFCSFGALRTTSIIITKEVVPKRQQQALYSKRPSLAIYETTKGFLGDTDATKYSRMSR